MSPETALEWDTALVEYKNVAELKMSQFTGLVAAVEHVFPQYAGQLKWSKKVLAGWIIDHDTLHTVPMSMNATCFGACHFSTEGMPRLGVGMVLQRARGLRPREMLELLPEHFSLPPGERDLKVDTYIVVNLGVKQGTKLKRPQSTVLRFKQFPILFRLILALLLCTPPGQKVFPYSYAQYLTALKRFQTKLKIKANWTPHSPRAGFASESVAQGIPSLEVKEQGRWISESSFRTYLDLVSVASVTLDLELAGLTPAIAYTVEHFEEWFSTTWLKSPY